jgi:tetratricopeptide (TPR) repeat protein
MVDPRPGLTTVYGLSGKVQQRVSYVDDPKALGQRLRAARDQAGLTQRQLAFAGCTAAYISRIEAGVRTPSLQLLRELARRTGVSEEWLATGTEPPASPALMDAEIALRLDNVDEAEALYTQALEEASNPEPKATALAGLGQIAFRRGDPRAAIQRLEEAVGLTGSSVAETPSIADTLGRSYALVGELESAIALFEQALGIAEQRDDFVDSVRFSVLLANALIDAGNFGGAEELLGRALAKAGGSSDPVVRARLYWSQSRLHAMQKDSETAARYARKALGLLELTEHTFYAARAHQLLAHIELDRGRPEEALELIRKGTELMGESGNELDVAQLRLEEARALAQLGRTEEAAQLAMEMSGFFSQIDPYDAGRSYALLGELFADLGQRAKAIELYELSAELLEPHPNRYLVETYTRWAELLEAEGRAADALKVLKKALGVQSSAGRPLTSH